MAAAVGAGRDCLERARALIDAKVDVLVLDSSHAHSRGVLDAVERLRERFPDTRLIAGNVATSEATRDAGRARRRRGQGRHRTGLDLHHARRHRRRRAADHRDRRLRSRAAERGVPVITDGGIKFSGDITKAIAAGAAPVMIGSLFAGTEESPGETILYQGRTYKAYRGMGSISAMQPRASADRYFQEGSGALSKLVPEGIEGKVPYKGSVRQMIPQLIGGLRSGMGLAGLRDDRGAAHQGAVRAHHRRRPQGEPRPRRGDHQGSAELLGRALARPNDASERRCRW